PTLVECGAIRERVSQELARAVFDAVKREVERLDVRDRWFTGPSRSPFGLDYVGPLVDHAGQHEEEIRQAIDVAQQHRGGARRQGNDAAFGATTDRAGDVQRRAGRSAAGKDEAPKGLELVFQAID